MFSQMKNALQNLKQSGADTSGGSNNFTSMSAKKRECRRLFTPSKCGSGTENCEPNVDQRKSVKRKLDSFDGFSTPSPRKMSRTLASPLESLQESDYASTPETVPVQNASRASKPWCSSPTVNLPNFVLHPEPRTPTGRAFSNDTRTPNWLQRMRDVNSVLSPERSKQEEEKSAKSPKTTPRRSAKASPASTRKTTPNKVTVRRFTRSVEI